MDTTQLLIDAAACGNVDEVQRLRWERAVTNIAATDGSALCWAAYYGHSACVAVLPPTEIIPQKTLRGYSSCDVGVLMALVMTEICPLRLAASQGHSACVRLLLNAPNIDGALIEAAIGGHEECMDILYPLADVTAVLQYLHENYLDAAAACLEKRVLLQEVVSSTLVAPLRKI